MESSDNPRKGAFQAPGRFPIARPKFLDPHDEIHHTKNRLPHWHQPGATYFLTFRLADSIPSRLLATWSQERDAWLRAHPPPLTLKHELEFHDRFSGKLEQWLDAGFGACPLRENRCATVVSDALRYFDGERYHQYSSVVMPNHIHAVVALCNPWKIEQIVHSWKRFSARRINEILGRQGPLWQRDYFERLIRDERHLANCLRYIRRNPEKANLKEGQFVLYEGDLAKSID